MSYKDKPQIRLYSYTNSSFTLQAIIDDFMECSFENNRFEAGQFSITINYNIPNALLFERGLFVQFGSNPYYFGEIINVSDSIGSEGKGSQIRTITGYDARYLFKRRIIKSLNAENTWTMTAKGELCMRNLIYDQCGEGAEEKRQLPIINTIPEEADAIGTVYSVSESFSNLYEVLTTIATQTEIGWRLYFDGSLTLEFYEGVDRSSTVRFDTSYDSLSNGKFTDSAESYANSIYVGGKGTGSDRDIYEGENEIDGASPSGLDRFEAWDNQSSMTTEAEYEAEALSMLTQYGQTLTVSGQGLAKCPYIYGEEYDVGDYITIAFSGKSAVVQILAVTEHWTWGNYELTFAFGKPVNDLSKQLQLMLKQIQKASDKTSTTDSVFWYTIPTDTEMASSEVVYNTIGFVGECAGSGSTFKLYLDDEKTGAKTYHIYFKQLGGGNLTLTTGVDGAEDLTLNSGTYVAIVYVDENGNVRSQTATAIASVTSGSTQPVTSGAVSSALGKSVTLLDMNDCYLKENKDYHSTYLNFQSGTYISNSPTTELLNYFVTSYQFFRNNYFRLTQIAIENTGGNVTAGQIWVRQAYGSSYDDLTFGDWVRVIDTRDFVEEIYSVNLSYSAGTIGTRGSQVTKNIKKDGYTVLSVEVYYISNSANILPLLFFNANIDTLYINAYRTTTNAVNETCSIRVYYKKD